jgi:YHS domain-containing protein
MLTRRAAMLVAIIFATAAYLPAARAEKVNTGPGGLAISGYDPVAYFRQDAAVEGSAEFQAVHDGATYRFASAANRDDFAADPERYLPQYGGFCAYAVANGYTAKVDPEAFSVVDGRLFLNYSKSVRSRWEKDVPGHIASGDSNWPGLSRQ